MEEKDQSRKDYLLALLERAKRKQEDKAAKKAEKKEAKPKFTDVEKFIKEYGVEAGSTPVPNSLVYFIYTFVWNPGKRKINRIQFFKTFSLYFHKQTNGRRRAYYLDKERLGVTKELLRRAKEHDKKLLEKERKNRLKKSKQKIPLPEPGEEPQV